jgi:hypothetical protein
MCEGWEVDCGKWWILITDGLKGGRRETVAELI